MLKESQRPDKSMVSQHKRMGNTLQSHPHPDCMQVQYELRPSESHHVKSDIIRVTKSGTPSCRPQIGTHTTATNTAPSNFDANNTTNRYIILSERLTTTNNQQQMGTASPSTQIVVITRPASTHCASTLLRITIDTLDLQRQAEKRCSLVSAYHELRLGPHAFMLHGKTNQSMSKQHHRRGKAYHIMHTLL